MTLLYRTPLCLIFFFFNDTAPTEIYTLSLHDALPICDFLRVLQRRVFRIRNLGVAGLDAAHRRLRAAELAAVRAAARALDRKSTRLNSSHANISYAVFCLKKKKPNT